MIYFFDGNQVFFDYTFSSVSRDSVHTCIMTFLTYLPSLQKAPLYPTLHSKHVPFAMLQWPSRQLDGQ